MSKRSKARARKLQVRQTDQGFYDQTPKTDPVIPAVPLEKPQGLIARPPQIDKYPVVIGQNLTGQYVSAALRLCTQGWRYGFVDLLNELLECDPDARGPVRARVLGSANGRHEVLPADLKQDDTDYNQAVEIADEYGAQFKAIPRLTQRTGQLAWGAIYGVTGQEILWDLTSNGWEIVGLSNIHSRRLNYPNPTSWDLHIYDQGLVGPGVEYMGPTTGVFGLRVSQYPGKFICHTPALNGDYPTRDGEGRFIVYNLLFKRMLMRATTQDFERVIKPRVLGYFNRRLAEGTSRSIANPEDEEMLDAVVRALASGGLLSGILPDSVKVDVLRDVSAMTATEFLSFLVRGYAKALLGQSFTTEPGANGNLATAEQAARDTQKIFRYDARCLCDTWEEDVARVWMKLNHPNVPRRCLPRHVLHVDELPNPKDVMSMAADGSSKMPELARRLDIDNLGELTGLKLLPEDKARPLPAAPSKTTPPDEPGPSGGEPPKPAPKNGAKPTNGASIGDATKTDTN